MQKYLSLAYEHNLLSCFTLTPLFSILISHISQFYVIFLYIFVFIFLWYSFLLPPLWCHLACFMSPLSFCIFIITSCLPLFYAHILIPNYLNPVSLPPFSLSWFLVCFLCRSGPRVSLSQASALWTCTWWTANFWPPAVPWATWRETPTTGSPTV